MSKLNLLIDLNGYEGSNANTCNPNFSRNAQVTGIDTSEEIIQEITVSASSTKLLFDVTGSAKKLLYLESTLECDIIVNGVTESSIKPIVIGDTTSNGIYFKSSDIETLSITNNDATNDLKIYYITVK